MTMALKLKQCAPVTGGATLATGTSAGSIIRNVVIANIDGTNACTVKVEITDSSAAATRSVIQDYSLAAATSLTLEGPFILESGDTMVITAGADNDLEATAAGLDFT